MYNYYGDNVKIKTWVKALIFFIILITLIFIYGRYINTKEFKVKEYNIINKNIPDNFYGVKIVQISDIYYKPSNKNILKKAVEEINKIKPDIVILSGDLLNSKINYSDKDLEDLKNILKDIDYNIGKFAIKGENDSNKKWLDIIDGSDFTDLNNKYEYIYNNGLEPILIVGISSNYKKNHIESDINDIYQNLNTDYKYSILVLHEADFIDYIDYSKFNLILAGHTLNGQVKIPFIGGIIRDNYSKKYYDEYYDLDSSKLYITSGISTNNFNFRILNSPSINLYRLRNK